MVELREAPVPEMRPWYPAMFGWVGVRDMPWVGSGWIQPIGLCHMRATRQFAERICGNPLS